MAGADQPVGREELGGVVEEAVRTERDQVPLTSASNETMPPTAGPIASAVSRCPSRIPSTANGTQATTIRPVISSHRPAPRLTPSEAPDAYSTIIVRPASA